MLYLKSFGRSSNNVFICQIYVTAKPDKITMNRKIINNVALITGSREGIGYQTALQLASRKWTVLMADKQDLEDAKNQIISKTSNSNIVTYYLDLASFKSVRKFTDNIKQTQNHLSVIVNNAGIFEAKEEKTIDNLNPVMQVNHLGPFLLTLLLTDLLKKSSPSRVIFLASSGAFLHTLDHDNLPLLEKEHYFLNFLEPTLVYYNSKLCNMIMSKEFAKRLQKYNVTSNCLHPGMTNSSFLLKGSNLKYLSPIAHKFIQFITQDPEKSGEIVTFLATSTTLSEVTGQYFVNYQVSQTPKLLHDSNYCNRIWKQAEELVHLTEEEKLLLN